MAWKHGTTAPAGTPPDHEITARPTHPSRVGKKRDAHSVRRTIRVSTAEGLFAQVHASIAWPGSVFLTKFAVTLGATPLHLGLLSAIGQFSQVFQPLGAVATRRTTSRKRLVVLLAGLGRGMVVLYGLAPLFLGSSDAMMAVLALFFLSTALQAVAGNAWIAWISDMVPWQIRARFFARRSQILLVAGLGTGFLAGAIVDAFESGAAIPGRHVSSIPDAPARAAQAGLISCFVGLFTCAALVGLVGLKVLNAQPERPKPLEHVGAFSMLADPFHDGNFRTLLLYGCWWMFTVGIGAPFWQPFMIRTLGMSLVHIQAYGLVSTVASLLVLRPWGILIDRWGNKRGMKIAILLGGLNPLVWLFATPEHHWMVYVEAVTSGIMWAGAGLVAMNFVLAIAPEGKRQIYSGVFGACTGLAVMTTMLLSGVFLPPGVRIGAWRLEPEQVLFAATGVLRWTTLVPLSWISEPSSYRRGSTLRYLWQFAKVRVEWMSDIVFRPRR